MVAPWIICPLVALTYTEMNMVERRFVGVLGCGCAPSFNTNDLTLTVYSTLAGASALCCWSASSTLPKFWRISYLGLCGVLALMAFRLFMRHNLWL